MCLLIIRLGLWDICNWGLTCQFPCLSTFTACSYPSCILVVVGNYTRLKKKKPNFLKCYSSMNPVYILSWNSFLVWSCFIVIFFRNNLDYLLSLLKCWHRRNGKTEYYAIILSFVCEGGKGVPSLLKCQMWLINLADRTTGIDCSFPCCHVVSLV